MKRFGICMACSTLMCAFLLIPSLLMAAELIEPTRTLNGKSDQPGRLSVFSEPPELEVTMDGTDIGRTPVISKEVEPGIHVIRIKDSETNIIVKPGQPLQYSWFKGSFIVIPVKTKEIQQQKPKAAKSPEGPKTKQSAENKEELQPFYWPLNPRGPIY